MEPFIATIMGFGGNFAPRGWAFCNGQLLAISQNDALFSILGTIYGGDGRTTFGLPDLRGRMFIGAGDGPGLSNRPLGARGGVEEVVLTTSQMPQHTHVATLRGEKGNSTQNRPEGNMLGNSAPRDNKAYAPPNANANKAMASESITVGFAGGSQSHYNMMPYITTNYIIALYGIYPSRS